MGFQIFSPGTLPMLVPSPDDVIRAAGIEAAICTSNYVYEPGFFHSIVRSGLFINIGFNHDGRNGFR